MTLDLLAKDLWELESLGIAETAAFQEQNRIVLSKRPSAYGTKAVFKLAALRTNSQTTITKTSTGQLGSFGPGLQLIALHHHSLISAYSDLDLGGNQSLGGSCI